MSYDDLANSYIEEARQSLAVEPSHLSSDSEKKSFRAERRAEADIKLQLSIAVSLDRIADYLSAINAGIRKEY